MKTFNQFLSEASDKERQAYFDRIYRQAKSSGKFSNRDWSSAEGDRYKTYGGK